MDNKVLDKAVEVALRVRPFAESKTSGRSMLELIDTATDEDAEAAMRAALLASLPVLLGEPVAWQRRIRASESHWSDWEEWIDMYGYGMQPKIGRWDAEYRPVYAPSLGEGE